MPRGVDQGPAEGALAEKCPSSTPVGLRETVVAPLTTAHVISRLRRCSFATRLSLWFVASRSNLSESNVEQAERDIARHPDPAPYGRRHPGKGDRDLVDRDSLGRRRRSCPSLLR